MRVMNPEDGVWIILWYPDLLWKFTSPGNQPFIEPAI